MTLQRTGTPESQTTEQPSSFDSRGTFSDSPATPALVLLVALLVAQHSAIVDAKFADVYPRSTAHQTQKLTLNLFDELLDFHQHLAAAQVDLPEEAARVLYKNLWQLYD